MHDDRFDHLTRRGAAVGGFFSAGLLALAASLTPDVGARKRRKSKKWCKKKCKKGPTCGSGTRQCGTECVRGNSCCGGCGGQQCCDGVCSDCCGQGQSICDGTCTNLATDGAHCGACTIACDSGVCIHGACACPDGISQCPAGCTCLSAIGGNICAADVGSGPSCTVNADCPLGSVCVEVSGGAFICTDPCLP